MRHSERWALAWRRIRPCAAPLLLLMSSPAAMPAPADSAMQAYFGAAVRGDLSGQYAALDAAAETSAPSRRLAERFAARFIRGDEAFVPVSRRAVVNDAVQLYRRYWADVLMKRVPIRLAEAELHTELRDTLERHGAAAALMSDAETRETLGAVLAASGLGFQQGRTPPYLDLLLWRVQERQHYSVTLTDGVQRVPVLFISDFALKGWLDFATFGHASAGGWATEDKLYCLKDQYDLSSESFLLGYLKHEARHFADYRLFPGLPTADLEYRAKLTELIYAQDRMPELLAQFQAEAANDPRAAHAYAAHQLLRGMEASVAAQGAPTTASRYSWPTDPAWIRNEARRQLDWHTGVLVEGGGDVVEQGVFASGAPGLVSD